MKFKDAADRANNIAALIAGIEEDMTERDFQREFFESLCDQFEKRNSLSDKQIAALTRIYERVSDITPEWVH